jgi:hypothetical protein
MKSSEVAMDDSNIALNLEPRIAVYLTYDYDYIKTPFINDAIILKYTKKRHEPGHKTILDGIKLKDKSEEKPKRSGGKVLVDENKKSKGKVLVNNEEASVTSEAPPPPKPQQPVVQQTFNKVDPTVVVKQEQELKANISKIPNFVPYNPNPTKKVNVIDETDIALKPSEKPIKKGGKQKC